MDQSFVYIGCFVKYEDFQSAIGRFRKNPLENDIQHPHVTFVYRPNEVDPSLFGESVHITIVGYGNDGTNEGVKVRIRAEHPALQAMAERIEVPHITIAVSSEGKPVNTKTLRFEDVVPIEMEGIYGGYTESEEVMLSVSR